MRRERMELNLLGIQLPPELESFLGDTNPWWENKPMPPLPPFPRWLFDHTLQRLQSGLAPVTVLRGPRQVGKTTLQQHIIDHLLHKQGVNPKRIFRAQFDENPSLKGLEDPILSLSRWFENRVLSGNVEMLRKAPVVQELIEFLRLAHNWAEERTKVPARVETPESS